MSTIPPETVNAWDRGLQREKEQVRLLGAAIGYGNMITLARECWAELLAPSLGEETARKHTANWGCTCEKCDCGGDE